MAFTPDRLTWHNEIPILEDIYERGGIPGKEYAFINPDNLRSSYEVGWRTTSDHVFKLIGPKGECSFMVCERGKYIPGVAPESGRRKCSYDDSLARLTGIDPTLNDDDEGGNDGIPTDAKPTAEGEGAEAAQDEARPQGTQSRKREVASDAARQGGKVPGPKDQEGQAATRLQG